MEFGILITLLILSTIQSIFGIGLLVSYWNTYFSYFKLLFYKCSFNITTNFNYNKFDTYIKKKNYKYRIKTFIY
jgi:hypothetical protein